MSYRSKDIDYFWDVMPDWLRGSQDWKDFVEMRFEDLEVPVTKRAAKRLANKFIEWGEVETLKALDNSVTQSFRGVFKCREIRGVTVKEKKTHAPGIQYWKD